MREYSFLTPLDFVRGTSMSALQRWFPITERSGFDEKSIMMYGSKTVGAPGCTPELPHNCPLAGRISGSDRVRFIVREQTPSEGDVAWVRGTYPWED